MIRTTLIPKNNKLKVIIPNHYIGKEIEVLLFTKEEIEVQKLKDNNVMSGYRGLLSVEEATELNDYITKSRDEWNRIT